MLSFKWLFMIQLNDAISILEKQSWYVQENALTDDLCKSLLLQFSQRLEKDEFQQAKVGLLQNSRLQTEVRLSKTCWVDNWQVSNELKILQETLSGIMQTLNESFFLSMKQFETQYAYYPKGGFYKKHVDQLKNNNHRQVTCLYYLNDVTEGGELVIYNKEDKMLVDASLSPKKGMMVIFFSGHIYHEVLPTSQERFSLTTWMRDDYPEFVGI